MNSITIKFKLYSLAGLISVGLVLLTIIAIHSFSNIKFLNKNLVLVQSSKADMLILRRNEKDFLARLDSKYQQKFKKNFDILIDKTTKFKKDINVIGLNNEKELSTLIQYLQIYESSFNKIVTLYQKIGLNHESGLRGDLRKSVHAAEALLKQFNSIQLTVDMLMLRRNEKDFILRKDEKYLKKFERNYALFNQNLNESSLSNKKKNDIVSKMNVYRSTFKKFSQNHIQLGLTPKTGLHGEMRAAIHKTEDSFNTISTALSDNLDSKTNFIYKKLLLIVGIFIALILGAMISMSRSVNRRLGYLQAHLNEVVLKKGDLSASIQIGGNDEVTVISQLFNQFSANLKETFSKIPALSETLEKESNLNTTISEQTYQLAISQQTDSHEVTEAVQQMVSATEEITGNIHVAANSADEANKSVLQGKAAIKAVNLSINSLATKLQSSSGVAKELEENTNDINSILNCRSLDPI